MAAAASWYYKRADERVGPITLEELCSLFATRKLGLETLVMSDAFKRWVPANTIAGLRAVCGVDAPPPTHDGGILDYDGDDQGGWPIGGPLILVAIGKIIGIPACALMAASFWSTADRLLTRGTPQAADTLHTLAFIMAGAALYELIGAILFFSKKRAAIPVQVLGYVAAVAVAITSTSMGVGRTPHVTEEMRWAVGIGPTAAFSLLWGIYFLKSRRVKATFVR